jgi:hypothetical protein
MTGPRDLLLLLTLDPQPKLQSAMRKSRPVSACR